jgi:hypothetical protein
MSGSIYFQLMSAGNHLATVSARRVNVTSIVPSWAYEVRYADKSPQRGIIISSHTEELILMSEVLQDYFAVHHTHDNVPS